MLLATRMMASLEQQGLVGSERSYSAPQPLNHHTTQVPMPDRGCEVGAEFYPIGMSRTPDIYFRREGSYMTNSSLLGNAA